MNKLLGLWCRMFRHKWRRLHKSEIAPIPGDAHRICDRCGTFRSVKPRKAKVKP